MTQAIHQTVRLSQGKHRDPDHGACVMELSSMLADEPFSDRPRCVDPVIAGFMRTYNDGIDDRRRQDPLPLASEAVGTRSTAAVQAARACAWLGRSRGTRSAGGPRRPLPLRPLLPDGRLGDDAAGAGGPARGQGCRAAPVGRRARAALAFMRELIAVGGRRTDAPTARERGWSSPRELEERLVAPGLSRAAARCSSVPSRRSDSSCSARSRRERRSPVSRSSIANASSTSTRAWVPATCRNPRPGRSVRRRTRTCRPQLGRIEHRQQRLVVGQQADRAD